MDLSYLERSLPYVAPLIEQLGATLSPTDSGFVQVSVNGLSFQLNTEEEFFILHEIFLLRTYDFLPYSDPVVVWDIGGNVGMAALYFAARGDVDQVYSFEPFPETVEAAKRNLALNEVSEKVHLTSAGIAGSNRRVSAHYAPEWRGNSGIGQIPEHLSKSPGVRTEEIQLLDAGEVLSDIRKRHPGQSIVAKIDCEGSEDEILLRLLECGQLDALEMLLIEWHAQGPAGLIQVLAESNFRGVTIQSPRPGAGMIYAHRSTQ